MKGMYARTYSCFRLVSWSVGRSFDWSADSQPASQFILPPSVLPMAPGLFKRSWYLFMMMTMTSPVAACRAYRYDPITTRDTFLIFSV